VIAGSAEWKLARTGRILEEMIEREDWNHPGFCLPVKSTVAWRARWPRCKMKESLQLMGSGWAKLLQTSDLIERMVKESSRNRQNFAFLTQCLEVGWKDSIEVLSRVTTLLKKAWLGSQSGLRTNANAG